MINDIINSSNNNINKKQLKNKYPIKVNENIAIGLFKESFLKILIEGNNQIRKKKLFKLQLLIENYTLPIRNLKCTNRKHNITNKYKNNQKSNF